MVWGARPVLGTTAGALREEWGACGIVKSTIILFKFLPVLTSICQVDYLHGSWWPKMEDLREMGIPCYRFLIYTSTRWPRVKSFNSNLFLKLVLYLSHVSQIVGSCSVPESWSGSTLAAFTGFRLDQRHHDVHRHYEYSCSCCWF